MIQALDPLLLETTLLRFPLSSGLHPLWSLFDFLLPCLFLRAHASLCWGLVPSEPLCFWSRPTSSSPSPSSMQTGQMDLRLPQPFPSLLAGLSPQPSFLLSRPRCTHCISFRSPVYLPWQHASSSGEPLPVQGNLFRFWGTSAGFGEPLPVLGSLRITEESGALHRRF